MTEAIDLCLRPKGVIERPLNDERGGVMMFAMLLLVALFGVAALVIDNSRQNVEHNRLQVVADAIALAGADLLDTGATGFRESKRAMVQALMASSIADGHEGPIELVVPLGADGGPLYGEDPYAQEISLKGTEALIGDYQIRLERGGYWYDESENNFSFIPFEGLVERNRLPVHLIANAVQVTITNRKFQNFFGSILGQSESGIGAASVAVFDDGFQREVLPFAIPACALMIDPLGTGDDRTPKFQAQNQCVRDIVISEVDPFAISDNDRSAPMDTNLRTEARTRYLSHVGKPMRKATVGSDGRLCTTNPDEAKKPYEFCERLYPLLGIFATVEGQDLREVLENGGMQARLGQRVHPLGGREATRFYPGSGASSAMRDVLAGSKTSFADLFFDDGGKPSAHFPHGRYNDYDLIEEVWPGKDDKKDSVILYGREKDEDRPSWTNPMCHDKDFTNFGPGWFANDKKAPAKRTVAMVIAPDAELAAEDREFDYCDFSSLTGGDSDEVLPTLQTKPTIVGFVEIDMFNDFNLRDLAAQHGGQYFSVPVHSSNYPLQPLHAKNPQRLGEQGPMGEVVNEIDAHKGKATEYVECLVAVLVSGRSIFEARQECRDKEPKSAQDLMKDFDDALGNYEPECFDLTRPTPTTVQDEDCRVRPSGFPPRCPGGEGTVIVDGRPCCESGVVSSGPFGTLNTVPTFGETGSKLCLPEPRLECPTNFNDDICWKTPIDEKRAFRGCSGVRVRMRCEDQTFPGSTIGGQARARVVTGS